jgi:23S rRNA pseudouridine1911/1915/1917 synthase
MADAGGVYAQFKGHLLHFRWFVGGFPDDAANQGEKQHNHDKSQHLDQTQQAFWRSGVDGGLVCAIADHMTSIPDTRSAVAHEADRLDRFLAKTFPDVSRARFQRLIAEGNVFVEGHAADDAGMRLKPSQRVDIIFPPAMPAEPLPENIALDVVFEDKHVIVINKPSGLVVHPAAGHDSGTLVNALIAHCGESLSGIGGVKRPGIVHRLDKDTSGLLVIAKNDAAHQSLSDQFQAHGRDGRLERAYLAVVWGVPQRPNGMIATGIARSTVNRQKMAVSQRGDAKEAITHYVVKERFGDVVALVQCNLETGRTHQIRVHMAHIGHPLLGDGIYGGGFKSALSKLAETSRLLAKHLKGQALHAYLLGFEHPKSGKPLHFEVALPAEMEQLLAALRLDFAASAKSTAA